MSLVKLESGLIKGGTAFLLNLLGRWKYLDYNELHVYVD
jgi:hypothetical protein